ncbi:MAG: tRNA pseudouridine(13) synthase TruD [Planctomycetota bacterium]
MILRRHPTDFIVDERLSPAFTTALRPSPPGHALYRLTKTSLTTPDATLFLARALGGGVKPGLVQHAGLKDKHAVTTQHISVPWKSTTPPPPTLTGSRGSTSWSATLLGFSPRAIEAADIDSNAFTIIIRELTPADITEMDRRISLLTQPSAFRLPPSALPVPSAQCQVRCLLFTNYFGDQRFGSARHHKGFAAQHLIRGDFETALKLLIATPARKDSGPRRTFTRTLANAWGRGLWSKILPQLPKLPERKAVEVLAAPGHEADFKGAFAALPNFLQQMAVDAFQSWIWNAVAREWIGGPGGAFSPPHRLDSDDDFGTMTFPYAAAVSAEMCSLQIPMLTAGLVPHPPWEAAARTVLAQLDPPLSISDFTIPGLRRPAFGDATRHLLATARDFAASPPEPDDSEPVRRRRLRCTVAFTLSRGCYATTVLRAIAR